MVYVGHVPHGFYEKQMLGYFSQFGELLRVRLSRSRSSGRSKHYAFLEFKSAEVAAIAAEAMDGYLMMKQKIECHVVPPEKVHPQTFAGANRRFKKVPWQKLARERHNRARTPEEGARLLKSLAKKEQKRKDRIKAEGIDYEYEGYAEQLAKRGGAAGGAAGATPKGKGEGRRGGETPAKEAEAEAAPAPAPARRAKRAKAAPEPAPELDPEEPRGRRTKRAKAAAEPEADEGTGHRRESARAKTPKATRKAPKTPASRGAKAAEETPKLGSTEKKKKLTPRSQYRTKLRPRKPKASS